MLEYEGIYYQTHHKVYKPAEDTFILLENLQVERRDKVLEIGTGTGIIAIKASKKSRMVVATDINPYAIKCATKNIISNKSYNIELRQGNLFEPVKGEKFNLILFNTPYLPTNDDEKTYDELNAAWDGGIDGRMLIDQFIDDLPLYFNPEGRVQMVQSSLSNVYMTLKKLEDLGFQVSVTARNKGFFEEIVVITGIFKEY
jgi:release factor glutamine methyltransferase